MSAWLNARPHASLNSGAAFDGHWRRRLVMASIRVGALAMLCAALASLPQPARATFFQQGPKLFGTGAVGPAPPYQGTGVALSADGNTAAVGGYDDNGAYGAVWVYTRGANGKWPQQGSKLVGSGAIGSAGQGSSVALSADGSTVIVGGPNDNGGVGAAWVFTRSLAGKWRQQGGKLVASNSVGSSRQGSSVGLSDDGNTAIVGGPADHGGIGAAWIYTRNPAGTWVQRSKRTANDAVGAAAQGASVALSGDGLTAIVGGPNDNSSAGAAWVYVFTSSWTQQGSKLVGGDAVGTAFQGQSVALSSDGNTAMIGGNGDNTYAGAAWVFGRSAGTWSQQGSKLFGSDAAGIAAQGTAVALSRDGSTAVSGGIFDDSMQGAVWVFTSSGGVWSQQGPKLVGYDAVGLARQGGAVAVSGDGNTVIVGGLSDNTSQGAAWIFVQTPASLLTATHEFTADSKSDLIARDGSGGVFGYYVYKNQTIQPNGLIGSVPSNWQMVAQRDFDGDGNPDILWRDPNTGTVTLWVMDGMQLLGATVLGYVPTRWVLAGAGDFNHDGVADILWRDKHTGVLAIWSMGGTRIKSETVGSVPTVWSVIGVSADGNIFWQHTNGDVAVWTMNGKDVANSYALATAPANSSLVGIGDFDGNGYADLLWRDNTLANRLIIWFVTNGALTRDSSLSGPTGMTVALTGDFNGDGYSDILWTAPNDSSRAQLSLMRGASVRATVAQQYILSSHTVQAMNAE